MGDKPNEQTGRRRWRPDQGGTPVNMYVTAYSGRELPKRLDKDRQSLLISMLPDPKVREELIERNLRLVVHMAKKFSSSPIDPDDLVSIGTIGLIKAIDTFKPEKNVTLATYASMCIQNEILMALRTLSKEPEKSSADMPIAKDRDGEPLYLSDVLGTEPDVTDGPVLEAAEAKTVLEALNDLPDLQWTILALRHGAYGCEPTSQAKIAAFLGVSRSYVSRLEKWATQELRKAYAARQKAGAE